MAKMSLRRSKALEPMISGAMYATLPLICPATVTWCD